MSRDARDEGAPATEPQAVQERYARRAAQDWRYQLLNPAALLPAQERQRAIAALLRARGLREPQRLDLLEVGCGTGGNLLELLRMGFAPERLAGIELLPERAAQARRVLPASLAVVEGDACVAPVAPASLDLVYQSTVFSSLLDDAFQTRLADAMWRWLRPGGAVLWYDFVYDNPRNPDVRGVPLARIRALFPQGRLTARRLTLAPPLARRACALHPALYPLLNALPLLRTHVLAWIEKPAGTR
ncbi:class I SAM-dependent methyltransferase [Caldimonas tepidiphila]|uniref:class I SAM-dependent methyltransferase n=1 Tax=Caldimonas tepidiphila TaxID=2315841 RepID=UPI000E5B639F|nr:class I SAM-dependent methyltransferase [Caldimonas tepidiphila]